MGRADWDSDDRSFRFWGICTIVASILWAGYFLGFGFVGFPESGPSLRTFALSLSAPVAMISIFAFRLGRRQARRRRQERKSNDP